jgi:tripartite-type tricarboxylate transporter receptor subunit TctC
MGVEIIDMSQPEFDAYVRADLAKWRKVAREGNIVVD